MTTKATDNKTTVTYLGIDLDVTYDYEPSEPQTWEEQGHSAQVWPTEIAITSTQINIMPLLASVIIGEIGDKIADSLES